MPATADVPANPAAAGAPSPPPIVGRLAPSPTGALHLGNARSFLAVWLAARLTGGRLLFRLEDLDGPRIKPGAADQARADLAYLGLDWDSEQPPQTARLDRYRGVIAELTAGRLTYPCICSRKDVQASASAPHAGDLGTAYPGTCRDRFADYPQAQTALTALPTGAGDSRMPALRLRLPAALPPVTFADRFAGRQTVDLIKLCGDFVIAKSPTLPAYQLAVVIDDADGGVNQVIRGNDLLASTGLQIHLQRLLKLPTPDYYHLPLVIGDDGRRLAKRHGDTRLAAFREQSVSGARVVGFLAFRSGWIDRDTAISVAELLAELRRVGGSARPPLAALLDRLPHRPLILTAEQIAAGLGEAQ